MVAVVPSHVEPLGQSLQEGESKYLVAGHLMVSSPSPPYARAKRRRERRAARADEATTGGDPGWTRETLTKR